MAQNFLYMFEFVVDELVIVKPNKCAPNEYPSCCEVSFRKSMFVSICDHEFGECVDPCKPKCGKNCLFALESPVTDEDRLLIHVYKKKTDQCKFLIGCTELPIKFVFDKVMDNFNVQNSNWEEVVARHINSLPNPKERKSRDVVDNDCDSSEEDRREQLCPCSELTKQLLPIFNLKGVQTGNVVLLIRLIAIGPTIVSTFPYSRTCNAGCDSKPRNTKGNDSWKKASDTSEGCSPECRFDAGMESSGRAKSGNSPHCSKCHKSDNAGCMPLRDPCHKEKKKFVCQRYFACNADKGFPFDEIEDDCQRAAECRKEKNKCTTSSAPEPSNSCSCEECLNECEAANKPCNPCGGDTGDPFKCDPCSADTCDDCVPYPCSPCDQCMQPCFQTPREPKPGPDAYDEFEACLNGSGLVIRVLKDTHRVESVCDGTEEFNDDSDNDCNKFNGKESFQKSDCSFINMAQRNNFARNQIKRSTGGHIINHPNLPKIRANIKYSGNDGCFSGNYHVPYSKIKNYCDNQDNKVDNYRSHRSKKYNVTGCESICEPKHRKDAKNCCVQVDRQDIKNLMKGLEVDTRKKGIEVCYRTCEETDSDVFLVKLGSKQKSEFKKNNIEIELKTPKMPLTLAKQHVTTETQINEKELDAAMADACKSKKGKGGKGKKK